MRRLRWTLTFLIATLTVYILIVHTSQRRTSRLHTWAQQAVIDQIVANATQPLSTNVLEMAYAMRLFKELFAERQHRDLPSDESDLYSKLERKLFPWIRTAGIESYLHKSAQRGIVISTGNTYFPLAVHVIRTIRLLNCTLPIEVFFQGSKDLDLASMAFLNSLPNVTAVDLDPIFDNEILQIRGWDTKPFAILASSFREVILLDADVVLLQSPDVMFSYREYKDTGALFFVDRTHLFKQQLDYPAWFKTIIPEPHSGTLRASRMYRGISHYEQESGVVVIDKSRVFAGLLAACCLNSYQARMQMRTHSMGDKETFWWGFEIAQDRYAFYDEDVGIIGVIAAVSWSKDIVLAGNIAHFNKTGSLLWFNGGIIKDKKNSTSDLVDFRYMTRKGRWVDLNLIPEAWTEIPSDVAAWLREIWRIWDPHPL